MIQNQLIGRGIHNTRVLNAFRQVDRVDFVPYDMKAHAYEDRPLPIGDGQTISQPYIVAYMAQALLPPKSGRILEIGTGSGYNAAILSRMASWVYSIEYFASLAHKARENLAYCGIENVTLKVGDGHAGWVEKAPFDAIVLTAAPSIIPDALLSQLKPGGKLLSPVGDAIQKLSLITRLSEDQYREEKLLDVRFVPLLS